MHGGTNFFPPTPSRGRGPGVCTGSSLRKRKEKEKRLAENGNFPIFLLKPAQRLPKTTGKRVIRKHAEQCLITAAISVIDIRGERERLFP